MKSIVMLLGLTLGLQAFASGIEGTYYTAEADLGGGAFMPETLRVITADTITDYSVHNGAVTVQTTAYKITGNQISGSVVTATTEYSCNGEKVTYLGSGTHVSAEFKLTEEALTITFAGIEFTTAKATPEQMKSVLTKPACTTVSVQ